MRVGIIGLQHESNTFLPNPTTLDDFRRGHLLEGEEIRHAYAESHHEVGGFFAGLADAGIEAVPLFLAWTLPGGVITHETCEELVRRMLSAVDRAGAVDGFLVAPHGAAVGEKHRDMDGHWLTLLREHVGPARPIISTLDLHANLSPRMVAACDATIAYRTNPHLDQRQRGFDAARLMARALRGEIKPTQRGAFPPVAINIERQDTAALPCKLLYDAADGMLSERGVLSNSILLGFPYADVEEMGSSFVVVTDGDAGRAQSLVDALAKRLVDHRQDFVGQLVGVDEALERAAKCRGPVCLLDMGDNVGGGSPGDGTVLLAAAYEQRMPRFFVSLCDPASAESARAAGVGQTVALRIGGKTDDRHGAPLVTSVTVRSLHDGVFTDLQARHGGQTRYNMGATAVVVTERGQTVMLNSRRIAPFSLEQILSCGLDPAEFQCLVAKGVHAPVAAYRPVCSDLIRVDTPGVTRADMTALDFRHRRRPLFPFESDV